MNKIEEKFFKIFEIKPKELEYPDNFECYPEITDRILLELICLLNETSCEVLASENIEDLKNEILETCIKVYNTPILAVDGDEYENTAIYDKIQQLFKDQQ